MARRRRTSQVVDAARQRLAGLTSINPEPNFGATLTLAAYATKVSGFDTKLDTYNQCLAALDDEQNAIDADEEDLRDWNRRMLSATEAQYGGDSSEYEAAGGTRTSERKKKSTPKAPGSTTPPTP
jgi:hypothetical protein